jgi:hypothetical protein
MNLDPTSAYGSVLYRLRLGVGPGAKVIAWVQRRSWWFFWNDHAPIGNAKIQLGNQIMSSYANLVAMVADYKEVGDEEAKAIKWVEENCLRDGISRPFRGPSAPPEERLPDNSKEVGEVIARIEKGMDKSVSSARLTYDRSRSETKPKSGGGVRSAYYPEGLQGVINAFSREFVNTKSVDHMVPFKGLNDAPKQDNKGAVNKQQHPNQGHQHHKPGGNQDQ